VISTDNRAEYERHGCDVRLEAGVVRLHHEVGLYCIGFESRTSPMIYYHGPIRCELVDSHLTMCISDTVLLEHDFEPGQYLPNYVLTVVGRSLLMSKLDQWFNEYEI